MNIHGISRLHMHALVAHDHGHDHAWKPSHTLAETTAKASLNDGYFLDLEHPADRTGNSAGRLSTVPVLCHVKRVRISKDAYVLELNYMFFFAYSGPYVVLGQERGGHDGDWEHITVRCEPDTGELIAVYYSAHRHGDGTWVPAEQVFFHSDTGRLLAFCALDGHGMHPKPQTNLRAFGVANELTSSVGRRWSSRKCIIVVPPGSQPAGPLTAADTPEVAARGGSYRKARPAQPAQYRLAPPAGGYDDGVVSAAEVEVEARAMPFMLWKLRWGTSVAPQLQRWFQEAEHPSGSSTPRRLCIPCIKM